MSKRRRVAAVSALAVVPWLLLVEVTNGVVKVALMAFGCAVALLAAGVAAVLTAREVRKGRPVIAARGGGRIALLRNVSTGRLLLFNFGVLTVGLVVTFVGVRAAGHGFVVPWALLCGAAVAPGAIEMASRNQNRQ